MKTSRPILILGEKPSLNYIRALSAVNLAYECTFAPRNFTNYSGLLLTGGGDILPFFYGKNISANNINIIRDKAEYNAFKYFYSHRLPILGICRGAQAINVFLGGTLKTCRKHASKNSCDVYHTVNAIDSRTPFQKISYVNSNHRQCVDKLAEKARTALITSDRIIEAFTVGNKIIAVQFHPERMNLHILKKIYGAFADAVNKMPQ